MYKDPLGYYAWLGVAPEATPEEVKAAFRTRARRLHPDVPGTGDAEGFRRLSEAYRILSDPSRRARYDRTAPAAQIIVNATGTARPPPRWTASSRPPRPPLRRSARLMLGGGAVAVAALCAAAFLGYRIARPSVSPPPSTARLARAVPLPEAASAPLPKLADDATGYVLPGGGSAVLWGGVPGRHLVRLGVLAPFTPVHAEALVVDGLRAVALADGHLAYMDAAKLMLGDRTDAERARCAYFAGIPPANGEVLARGRSGQQILVIVNREPSAAMVTLSKGGALVARIYVDADRTARVSGLPAGPWAANSRFGELWSRGCGRFVAGARPGAATPLVRPGLPLVISPAD